MQMVVLWCYGAIDRDSGNFMIKNYHHIQKCLPSNKNKMCTTKFLASRFKDEITKQPSLRIWEIQELWREELGLHVGVHTSQPASHNSQFTVGQSSQRSSHPQPTSSYQPGPTRFNQPASTTSNSHASSTTVCGDTSRVKRARETAKTSQPPPFVDTSIPVTRGITSQLPPRTRQTAR
ncbi:hypothetical protein KY289_008133 [Solanum tuberosum]|nr:hypothetical protein KY289_008133 [Solanum tuberosum]